MKCCSIIAGAKIVKITSDELLLRFVIDDHRDLSNSALSNFIRLILISKKKISHAHKSRNALGLIQSFDANALWYT